MGGKEEVGKEAGSGWKEVGSGLEGGGERGKRWGVGWKEVAGSRLGGGLEGVGKR